MPKTTIYYNASRKKEKLEYIRYKNKCQKLGFYTFDKIEETTQWVDLYFLSKKYKTIYNATISTTKCAWLDLISEKAWSELHLKTYGVPLFEFIDLEPSEDMVKNIKSSTIYNPELFCLNGLTAHQFLEEKKAEIIHQNKIFSHELAEIFYSYKFGIGLNLVVHEPYISIEIIQKTIQKFLNNDEKTYIETPQYSFS